jgi:membrane-bound lytic murein transglycosylase D
MRLLAFFWAIGPLLTLLAGCATPEPRVKVTYDDIETPAAPPAETAPTGEPAADLTADAATTPEERAQGALPALGAPLSTKEVMEQALAWAAEGLRQYERGDSAAAHKSLTDARIMLLEADLPAFMADQGLGALKAGLPEELRRYDIEAILRDLERTDRPNTAERAERGIVDREVRRILWQFGDTSPDERYLGVLIDETHQYINFFRSRYRPFFERAFLRKHKYWPTIQEVFTAKKIPPDLGYVALVESGFSPRAVSHANALGLWQFIPETGRRYGLESRDDFHDVRKSTLAAADYLLELIGIFGSRSFLLATAAYNAGEGKIVSCLRKVEDPFQKRDFWEIRGCLALETREYVPKIMAAAVIGSDPKRFGFDLPSEDEMRQRYDVVLVPQVTSLARLAELSGVSVADLRLANNELEANATVTPGRHFPLYVPLGTRDHIAAALAAVPEEAPPSVALPAPIETASREPRRSRTHIVRRGDTLGEIADKYGLDVKAVASSNNLRKPYTLSVGQRLEIPAEGGARRGITYTVKSGNTLEAVAELFGVSGSDIKSWNGLRSGKLKDGQKLEIHPETDFEMHTYKVRPGDNLSQIASRYRVSIESLQTANGLRSSRLRVGERLVVWAGG